MKSGLATMCHNINGVFIKERCINEVRLYQHVISFKINKKTMLPTYLP